MFLALGGYLLWAGTTKPAHGAIAEDSRPDRPDRPDPRSDPESDATSHDPKARPRERQRQPREDHPAEAVVTLLVTDPQGRPMSGSVSFQASADPLDLGAMLALRPGLPGRGRGYGHQELVRGRAEIRHSGRQWLWLCAIKPPPSMVCRYLLLPPARGRVERHVVLDDQRRSLHVFVLSHDLERPQPDQAVDVYLQAPSARPCLASPVCLGDKPRASSFFSSRRPMAA